MILDAALLVFAEKGYHDARISDITRRAETAYGLVHHDFKDKEEILDTIFEERWIGFIAAIRAIREDDRPAEEKLVAIAARIFIGGLDNLVTSRALELIEVEGDEDANAAEMARTRVELFMRGMSVSGDGDERGGDGTGDAGRRDDR